MPTSSTNILPQSPSLSVQTQKPTPLRSEPNSNQKKDNSNDAVLKNERPKEPIPTPTVKSPSKKPALKDMMKMFDFNCSDSDSE